MLFIFDMGDVVTNTFLMEPLYKKLNMTEDDFEKVCHLESDNIWKLLQIGKITSEQFWTEFNNRIGKIQRAILNGVMKIGDNVVFSNQVKFVDIPQIDTDLFRLYFHPTKNMQTIELIQNLKKKHRVVCGTNTIQSFWENHLERGDYAFFNQTYASNKIGFAKPDPRFFELILEAEATEPQNAFFTDDKLENVEAAKKLGINAVHFTSAQELIEKWQIYC
ncbi:MAG: HAD-IA family hydrolase [Treponema sp.]|nr:HAD-IA family hydrolase [Treponema sp.]